MADDASNKKRIREEYSDESPEAKRLLTDQLLDILDSDNEATGAGDRDPAVLDLDSVMRSLEEEIALPPSDGAVTDDPTADQNDMIQHELGYLLGASDDELGLPPTVPSSAEADVDEADEFGIGPIWGFEDLNTPMASLNDDAVFQYADALFEPLDFYDSVWRPESLRAV